jgi:3-hydroxyacyl-[acyl-carrier-protein] dehydratase
MDKITDILPHRYPFLMIDGIISRGEDEVITFKNVSYNEPQFQGHFPNNPIMPGVLILEGMAQSAGLITLVPGKTPLFIGADKVRFRRSIKPGDKIIYDVKIVGKHLGMISVEATATVNDELCAKATLLLGMER